MKEGSSAYSAQRQGVWGFIPLRRRRPAGAPTTLHYTCYKVGMREGWKLMRLYTEGARVESFSRVD
eukprot:scaffold249903_cov36-Tisochrysis_lutea.AAC.3